MKKTNLVGIVILSHNAHYALALTLSSLRLAKNHTAYQLILIDNASDIFEKEKIRKIVDNYSEFNTGQWTYLEENINRGFSGGNNIGIKMFLANNSITHICLLNSDVIVTDFWIDRLLGKEKDIISAVTNKAESEQCIPIDYNFNIQESFNPKGNSLSQKKFDVINDFARRWHTCWDGNVVDVDVTFFCVIVSRRAINDIGLLDEKFYPGGYEDNDYCIRARNAGYQVFLSRDVFLHHWGSASFGQLQHEYFQKHSLLNKNYLMAKHKMELPVKAESPILSFYQDLCFVLNHTDRRAQTEYYAYNYLRNIQKLLEYYKIEFVNYNNEFESIQENLANEIKELQKKAESFGDLTLKWKKIELEIKRFYNEKNYQIENTEIKKQVLEIADALSLQVNFNFTVYNVKQKLAKSTRETVNKENNKNRNKELIRKINLVPKLIKRALVFLFKFKGIIFFGGYFYPERDGDGYFQRIKILDRLFSDVWRIYVEGDDLNGRPIWYDRPESKVLVLRFGRSRSRDILLNLFLFFAVLKCRRIYYHSVLRMFKKNFRVYLYLPFIKKAIDFHGVVPEEFRYHDDYQNAFIYENLEKLALQKSGVSIYVTNTMKDYFIQKFPEFKTANNIIYPMFPNYEKDIRTRSFVDNKPLVVYAGGIHKWQQVPKMIDAISKTYHNCKHFFFTQETDIVKELLPAEVRDSVIVESKSNSELREIYSKCHYGFILRENIIVNKVACPTKLVEYITMGVIPIVDAEDIGDFKNLGFQYISLKNFIENNLPTESERISMAKINESVYLAIKEIRDSGAKKIRNFFLPIEDKKQGFLNIPRIPKVIFKQFSTLIKKLKNPGSASNQPVVDYNLQPEEIQLANDKCDILMQVENFQSGGLENAVLDLSNYFNNAGYKISILILGIRGEAVNKANDLGVNVFFSDSSDENYRTLIKRIRPKIVVAHYSFVGFETCHYYGIPFIQVIHSIYMWFDESQLKLFKKMSEFATLTICVSEDVKNYCIKRLGSPKEKTIVINYGIYLDNFKVPNHLQSRANLRNFYNISDSDFVFLNVGAINHQKNQLGLLKAFKIVSEKFSNARLIIAGPCYEPLLFDEINNYISANNLNERIKYVGAVNNVNEYYKMADALVLTSFFEGGPLCIIEAIISNISIISTSVGHTSIFSKFPGVQLVNPIYDMVDFHGRIWELESNSNFEKNFAEKMVNAIKNPILPNIPPELEESFNAFNAYKKYLVAFDDFLNKY